MGVSNRKITVVVDGTSAELQDAVAKATDSLKLLGDVTAEQSKLAIDWGEKLIKSNDSVAASYGNVTSAARATADVLAGAAVEIDDAAKMQSGALAKVGVAATSAAAKVAGAADKQAMAVMVAADDIRDSSKIQEDAFAEAADMATLASADIVRAVARQAEAVVDASLTADDAIKLQIEAQARLAEASTVASREVTTAAEKETTAVKGASDATVTSSERATTAVTANSEKQAAGFAASGSGLVKLGKLTTETAAIVAAGSLYMSSKFEASTTRLLTQAGATERQIKEMRTGILAMAADVGQSPEHLSEGLYHVVSSMNKVLPAATRTSEELTILRIAAQGAAIGNTSIEETTYALASAMNALHLHADQAQHTMGLLNAIVGSGDMTMNDLLASLKSGLIPSAQTFGVSLQSVGAALAVMGDQGMRGALAGTRLRMSLSLLAAPSEKASEVLGALGMSAGAIHARTKGMSEALTAAGLSTTTMATDLRKPDGIVAALSDLRQHLLASGLNASQVADVFGRAFGGGRMSASIELLSESVGRVGIKYQQIGNQIGSFGTDWNKTQETLSFKAKQAEAAVEALGVTIGTDLTPPAEAALHDLEEMAKWFDHNKMAAEALAATITGVLGVAVSAFLINRVAKMVEGMKQLGAASSWLRGGFTASSTGGAGAAGAGAAGELEGKGMIGGSRTGLGLPGSMTDPVVVAIESGQYAGLGGESAAMGAVSGSEGDVKTAANEVAKTGAPAEAEAEAQGALFASGVGRKAEAEAAEAKLFPEPVPGKYTQLGQVPQSYKPSEVYAAANPGAADAEAAARSAAAKEGEAASASVLSSVKSGVGSLMDGLMKGGLVAGIGLVGSQVAGSAIGGKTGKEVSSIGSDAAIGAAIGTVIEPGIGTAIGGALGGVAGELKHLHVIGGSRGGEVTEAAAKGTSSSVQKHLEDNINTADKTASEAYRHIQNEGTHGLEKWSDGLSHTLHNLTDGIIEENHGSHKPTPGQKTEIDERKRTEEYKAGKQFGGEHFKEELHATATAAASSSQPALVQLEGLITDTEKRFAKMPPAVRAGAYESIMAMVKVYQEQGHLPPTAVEEMNKAIEAKFPALKASFSAAASGAVTALNNPLLGASALKGVENLVSQWTNILPGLPTSMKLNMTNAATEFSQVNAQLLSLAHSGPEAQRVAASAAYKNLRDEEIKYFGEMRGGIEGEIKSLSSRMHTEAPAVVGPLETAFHRMVTTIEAEMASGVKATGKGTKEINAILGKELKALGLGAGGNMVTEKDNRISGKFGAGPGTGSNALQPSNGAAQGGLMQLGRPGEAGHDTIPLSVGGQNIVAGAGETVAVFTRHQRADAESKLPGGLPGIFANKTPNYMSSGGLVASQNAPGARSFASGGIVSYGGLENAWIQAKGPRSLAPLMAAIAEAESNGELNASNPEGAEGPWQIKGQIVPGNIFNLMVNAENAVAKWRTQGLGAWETYTTGAYRKYLNGSVPPSAATGGGSAAAASAKPIATPKVKGSGAISQIAQAALNKIAGAANTVLSNAAPAASAGGGEGAGGAGGAPSGVSGLGSFDGLQVADWIIPELEYAQQHGWKGRITSGYRSPTEVVHSSVVAPQGHSEHQGIQWPHGAVDFGSPAEGANREAFERAAAGYTGHRLIKATGFTDLGHMSGTGHALGGFVKMFAEGGPVNAATGLQVAAKSSTAKFKKPSVTKIKKTGTGHKPKPTLAGLIHSLGAVPNTENVKALQPWPPKLEALANSHSLLSKVESIPDRYVIGADGMTHLAPTIQAGQRFSPGMSVTEGLREQVAAEARAKGNTALVNPLTEQGEILNWLGELPSHHLLSSGDVSLIGDKRLTAGMQMGSAAESIIGSELGENQQMTGVEQQLQTEWHALVGTYKTRQKQVLKHARAEDKRYANIKSQIARLETGSLKKKVKDAKDKAYINQLKADATESSDTLAENLAGERALPTKKQDKHLIEEWEKEKIHISRYSAQLSKPLSGTDAAVVALQKNELTNELPPLSASLKELAGSGTSVGTGGDYGKLAGYIKSLNEGVTKLGGEIATETTATIPGLKVELETTMAENRDANLKPAPLPQEAGESAQETTLNAALKEQAQLLGEKLSVQGAELSTFKNFLPQIPHYEKGGPVLEDGLIYAHEGEHVVPKGGSLVANSTAPNVAVHNHFSGELAPLISLIDSRVTHPANVRQIGQMQMRRTDLLRGRPAR